MSGNFPLTCCLLSEIYDNFRHMWFIMTNHRSSWLGRFFSARMCFSQPALFYTLSLDNFEVSTTLFLCASSRSNNGESSCPPGPLPRTAPESLGFIPACCRGEHLCQLFVETFRLAYSHGVRPDYYFFEPHSFLCFPLFWGNSFLDRHSTALVSDISQWSRACCMLRIFSAELLRELTVHKLRATMWIDCSHHAQLRPRVIAVFLVFYRTFMDRLAAASDIY